VYGVIPGGKTAWVWRCPPTPSSAEVKERVELYLYSLRGLFWGELYHSLGEKITEWLGILHSACLITLVQFNVYDSIAWWHGVSLSMAVLSHRKPAYAIACTESCCIQGHVKSDTVCYGSNCGVVSAILSAVVS
jgi:hypothetical protein